MRQPVRAPIERLVASATPPSHTAATRPRSDLRRAPRTARAGRWSGSPTAAAPAAAPRALPRRASAAPRASVSVLRQALRAAVSTCPSMRAAVAPSSAAGRSRAARSSSVVAVGDERERIVGLAVVGEPPAIQAPRCGAQRHVEGAILEDEHRLEERACRVGRRSTPCTFASGVCSCSRNDDLLRPDVRNSHVEATVGIGTTCDPKRQRVDERARPSRRRLDRRSAGTRAWRRRRHRLPGCSGSAASPTRRPPACRPCSPLPARTHGGAASRPGSAPVRPH